MAPSISVRNYIQWLPDTPSEPTKTLVLTSAENRFVDIRIFKPLQQSDAADVLSFSRLDWAFAGTSSSELKTDQNGHQYVHSTWRHWIDSRHPNAEKVNDEGDMFPQKNGTTVERGSMVNPATGQMTNYEECWTDVEPSKIKDDEKGVCAVLQLHDDANKARGMVVRVGQFCQGILRVGERVTLEQWAWTRDGGWQRQARMGDFWVPCGAAMDEWTLSGGAKIKFGDYEWEVIELSDF